MQDAKSQSQTARYQQHYRAAVDCLRNGRLAQARSLYSALLSENPGRCELHNDFGYLLQLMGQPAQAVTHFNKALLINPTYVAAAYNLAGAQAQMGSQREAIESYQRVLTLNPDLVEAHNNLGNLLRGQGELDQAIEHYRKALDIRPEFVDAAANLAVVLENLHRLDEAREAASMAVQATPLHPVANLVLAQVELREGSLDDALKRLNKLRGSELSPVHEAAVAAELGQVNDRLGRYQDAVEAILHGKKVWREVLDPEHFDDDSFVQGVHQNHEWFSSERIAGWASSVADGVSAPVFLVGFPRSGTTLTEAVLAAHPAFVTSREKPFLARVQNDMDSILGRAVNYPQVLLELNDADIRRLRKAYWKYVDEQLIDERQGKRLIDKLPLNLVELGFVRRIFPESPVIMVLRDPRDACLSGFMQAFELNSAMVAFLDMERTADFYVAVMDLWLHYRALLGLNWIEFRYEDLIHDFETSARALLNHVDESWNDRVLHFHESAAERYAHTPSYRDVTSPLYSRAVGRWKNYGSVLAPVADRLGKYVAEFGYDYQGSG